VLLEGADSAVELAFLLSFHVQKYVEKHGNTPEIHVEVLGAIEHAKIAPLFNPRVLGSSN
jgi:hypothetical protein